MLVIGAAVLGGTLLLGMGGYALTHRRLAVVPLIEADQRPLRVKPDNAGGMQVAGADEQVLGGQSGGAERMAPAAEAPAPQALRAQMQAAAPVAPPSPPVATAPSPAEAPAPPVARIVPPPPARPPATGGTMVQLAAVASEAAAQTEWTRLAKKLPDLLGGRQPVVQRTEKDGHPMWRVRTGGFGDVAEATGFCAKVRARGAACTLGTF